MNEPNNPNSDHLHRLLTTEELSLAKKYNYFNLLEEAVNFLHWGELYFNEESLVDLDELDFDEQLNIRKACIQMVQGKGLSIERPFMDLGISGFNLFLRFMGYSPVIQYLVKSTKDGIYDKIEFRNKSGKEIVLFNFVMKEVSEPFDFKGLDMDSFPIN